MVQEGIGRQFDDDTVILPAHPQKMHDALRTFRLATLGTEGGEIMVADQMIRRLLHFHLVQRIEAPSHLGTLQGRFHRAVEDDIAIIAGDGTVTGMEARVHFPRPQHSNVIR